MKIPDTLTEQLDHQNTFQNIQYLRRKIGETSNVIILRLGHNKKYECYYDNADTSVYWYLVSTDHINDKEVFSSMRMLYPA